MHTLFLGFHKKAVCWRRTNMFSSLNLFHSQRYYRNLWPRGFLEAHQEWSHKHLPQKCETFFYSNTDLYVLPSFRDIEHWHWPSDQSTDWILRVCDKEYITLYWDTYIQAFPWPWTAFSGVRMFVCFLQKKNYIYIRTKIFFFGGKLIQGKQAVKAVFPEMFVHCLLIHQLTKST